MADGFLEDEAPPNFLSVVEPAKGPKKRGRKIGWRKGDLPAPKPPKENKPKNVTLATFVPAITVRGPDEKAFKVPLNKAANRAANQVLISKVRSILEQKLAAMKPEFTPARDLKDMAAAVLTLDKVSQIAYEEQGEGSAIPDFNPTSAVGKMAGALLREAASGFAQGSANAIEDRFARMAKLGASKPEEPKKVTPLENVS